MDMDHLAETMGTRLKVFEKDVDEPEKDEDDELNESDMDFHI